MKILFADKDIIYCDGLAELFHIWEFEAVTAYDGQRALELLFQNEDVYLAILGWSLPKMEGIELRRQFRIFLKDDCPRDMANLKEGILRGEAEMVRASAHSIMGAFMEFLPESTPYSSNRNDALDNRRLD